MQIQIFSPTFGYSHVDKHAKEQGNLFVFFLSL